MSKTKFSSSDRDLIVAAQFGPGDAFDVALQHALSILPDPGGMREGEWKRLREHLSHLGQSIQNAVTPENGMAILSSLTHHPSLTARCLAASSLAEGWSSRRQTFLPGMAKDHIRVRECMTQALTKLPDIIRIEIASPWLSSNQPALEALGLAVQTAQPTDSALAILRDLRPVESHHLGEPMIEFAIRVARHNLPAVVAELQRWSEHPLPGDAFLIARICSRPPLRNDLSASFALLTSLVEHSPSPTGDSQYIIAAVRSLSREHGPDPVLKSLESWIESARSSVQTIGKKAARRLNHE